MVWRIAGVRSTEQSGIDKKAIIQIYVQKG